MVLCSSLGFCDEVLELPPLVVFLCGLGFLDAFCIFFIFYDKRLVFIKKNFFLAVFTMQ